MPLLSEETFIIKFQNWPFIFIAAFWFIFLNLLAISGNFDLYYKIFLSSVGVIFLLIFLFIVVHKIIIIKDSLNKKILIKIVNYLCLTKKKLNFDLGNIHFYVNSELQVPEDGPSYTTHRLFIINDYKNLVGIDLNESNIKQKPIKCIYYFRSPELGNYNYKQFENALNNFVGSPKNYKNPLLFDINNYLEESKKIKSDFRQQIKFIKFSEHFFTYYPKGYKYSFMHLSTFDNCLFYFIYCVDLMLIFSIFIAVYISIEIKNFLVLLIIILVCVVFHLLIYCLYKCCKSSKENILRIDFIYSKDFERIFIGVVKYTKTKYIKTIELQKNDISKFISERVDDINFYLKVLLKNDKKEYICTLEKQREDELEGLICFLNGEIIAHTKHNVNSYEQI